MFELPIHSPIQELFYEVPEGFQLFIKRDDLIDPLISGNKWRKLKHTLIKAKLEDKNHLISFGGPYSNHLIALASASSKFGFRCTAFVRAEEIQQESELLGLCRLFGMEIIRVSREAYRNKKQLFEEHFGNNKNTFFIDEGGLSEEGAKGCEEIVQELNQQYNHIFIASGTGCTLAGIQNGISAAKLSTTVHGVVVHHGVDEVRENTKQLCKSYEHIHFHDTKIFGRYAQHTDELLRFSLNFQQATGILLDPIYTAKSLFKCYQWMNENKDKKSSILFIHTGGILGNLGKLDAYRKFLSR